MSAATGLIMMMMLTEMMRRWLFSKPARTQMLSPGGGIDYEHAAPLWPCQGLLLSEPLSLSVRSHRDKIVLVPNIACPMLGRCCQ